MNIRIPDKSVRYSNGWLITGRQNVRYSHVHGEIMSCTLKQAKKCSLKKKFLVHVLCYLCRVSRSKCNVTRLVQTKPWFSKFTNVFNFNSLLIFDNFNQHWNFKKLNYISSKNHQYFSTKTICFYWPEISWLYACSSDWKLRGRPLLQALAMDN